MSKWTTIQKEPYSVFKTALYSVPNDIRTVFPLLLVCISAMVIAIASGFLIDSHPPTHQDLMMTDMKYCAVQLEKNGLTKAWARESCEAQQIQKKKASK